MTVVIHATGCGSEPEADSQGPTLSVADSESDSAPSTSHDTGPSDTAVIDSQDEGSAQVSTASALGTDADTEPATDTDPNTDAYCVEPPSLPVSFELLPGFTGAEDFAFDAEGAVISVDAYGNLTRQLRDGAPEVLVPAVAQEAAGIAFLRDGDLIVASVGDGTLVRVATSGSVTKLLSGLEYPNGLDVDFEDFVYVAEHNAGRIRRVDASTGEYTVIASGLLNPNGLSFSPDYKTLYCGSFGAGIIYKISKSDSGDWGTASELARTPGAPGDPTTAACQTKAEGDSCGFGGMKGKCEAREGVLKCAFPEPCDGKDVGDPCLSDMGITGTCLDSGPDGLFCAPTDPCASKTAGGPVRKPIGQAHARTTAAELSPVCP